MRNKPFSCLYRNVNVVNKMYQNTELIHQVTWSIPCCDICTNKPLLINMFYVKGGGMDSDLNYLTKNNRSIPLLIDLSSWQ